MFGNNDDKPNDNAQVVGPVLDENIISSDGGSAPQVFDGSNISLPGSNPVNDTPHDDQVSSSQPEPTQDVDQHDDDHLLSANATADSSLLNIKQEALQQLSPLVGHLDQTPEEKFRTTMMMIQASDDQSLVSAAYEAAKNISDDKVRAQALLDIINEINYFTQQSK